MATSRSTAQSNVTLKLLIDSKEKRVLFAEAGKDFVDFLFTLLSLPVGTIIKLLSTNGMVVAAALGKLYESFGNLSDTYLQPNFDKDIHLRPNSPIGSSSLSLLSLTDRTTTCSTFGRSRKLYICVSCNRYASDERPGAYCPGCHCTISRELYYVAPPAPQVSRSYVAPPASQVRRSYVAPPSSTEEGGSSAEEAGIVKGVVTYMIMDDLEVKPMSTISSITILNKFNIKEVGALVEKTVSVRMEVGLKLLKASLESNMVLTDVFLGEKMDISPMSPFAKKRT